MLPGLPLLRRIENLLRERCIQAADTLLSQWRVQRLGLESHTDGIRFARLLLRELLRGRTCAAYQWKLQRRSFCKASITSAAV